MPKVLLQPSLSFERKAMLKLSMIDDSIELVNADIFALPFYRNVMMAGALPVGSITYMRKAFETIGVKEPPNISYPDGFRPFAHRPVWVTAAAHILESNAPVFVKPMETKLFTGFVLDNKAGAFGRSNHDIIQYNELCALPSTAPLWASEVVEWVSEYRYYVVDGKVIGSARYDGIEGDAPVPDAKVVSACIEALNIQHPYALDMGVLRDGRTALVEANDAWAIGLYKGVLTERKYFDFLYARWSEIISGLKDIPQST